MRTFPNHKSSDCRIEALEERWHFSACDLAVPAVNAPMSLIAGQQQTFSFTVQNKSGNASSRSNWQDSVYLSPDNTFDGSARLVGRVKHTGGLAAGASYTASLTAPAPGMLPGQYHVLVIADSRDAVVDANRGNNTGASTLASLDWQSLNSSLAVQGTIKDRQNLYFKAAVQAGTSDIVTFAGAGAGDAEISASINAIPTRDSSNDFAFDPSATTQTLLVPVSQNGTEYLLIHGRDLAGNGSTFTLSQALSPEPIYDIAPKSVSNTGKATLKIRGNGFTSNSTVTLQTPGIAPVTPTNVYVASPNTLYATFDFTGKPAGQYDLLGDSENIIGAVTVTSGSAGSFHATVLAPQIDPISQTEFITVNYANTGGDDIAAPLLELKGVGVSMALSSQGQLGPTDQFLAINPDGPAGILPPEASFSRTFRFRAPGAASGTPYRVRLLQLSGTPIAINLSTQETALRPSNLSGNAYLTGFASLLSAVGPTTASYQAFLDSQATAQWSAGAGSIADVSQLFLNYLETGHSSGGATEAPQSALPPVCTQAMGSASHGVIQALSNPQNLLAPAGQGANHGVPVGVPLPYKIQFAQPAGIASTRTLIITQPMDPNLDLDSFRLGDISINGLTVSVPADRSSYSTRIDLTASGRGYVVVSASINYTTGVASWTFSANDPTTGDVPSDPTKGFLRAGEAGSVSYTISALGSTPEGTTISSQAFVAFDQSPPLQTPLRVNTVESVLS